MTKGKQKRMQTKKCRFQEKPNNLDLICFEKFAQLASSLGLEY